MKHIFQEIYVADDAYISKDHFESAMDTALSEISLRLQDLSCYFNINKIFFNDSITESIMEFADFAIDDSNPLVGYIKFLIDEKRDPQMYTRKQNRLDSKANEYIKRISSIRSNIENEFMKLLGNNKKENKGSGYTNELLWVPEPRMIDGLLADKK